jgi:hypothetical protein
MHTRRITNMPPTALSRLPIAAAARVVLAASAAAVCGYLGLGAGERLGYVIATLIGREIAELKDMLIWSILASGIVSALAGIWLSHWITRASKGTQQGAAIVLAGAVACGAILMLASFDWPKSAGTPVVDYELRLPAGTPLPAHDAIDITAWSDRMGQGCYIKQVRMVDGRPEITGTIVLHPGLATVSLKLDRATEGHWRLPIAADARLEKAFRPWQRIEFIPTPNKDAVPLPAGDYEIRYRVRKYS